MTATPWGDAERLRERKLRPGPGSKQEAVLASQRERLLAATVAVVADKGYESTRVEDILVAAGVSRNAFYKHFSNKRDCFLATLTEIAGFARPTVIEVVERTPGSWEDRLRALIEAMVGVVVAQPAMARVAWVEVYAAGPDAIAIIERLDAQIERLVHRALQDSPDRADMPRDIVAASVGAVRRIVYARVHGDRIEELRGMEPHLLDWMMSYRTPPVRLRRPRRIPPELRSPEVEPRDPRERILAAVTEIVAEKGYPEMAITEIAARAGVSLTTFYQCFEGKEAAFRDSFLLGQEQLVAATLEHFAAAPDWPHACATGMRAFLGYLATHPATAQLGNVGAFGTGALGFELRARTLEIFKALLDEGFRQHPVDNPVLAEGIAATVDSLLFTWLRHKGAERLYEIAPTATFVTLAPFVGSERAAELANADPFPAPARAGSSASA